jgi:hypothetical protein
MPAISRRHYIFTALLLGAAAAAEQQPGILAKAPDIEDYREASRLSGLIPDRDSLSTKPRVVVGYLSDKDWALVEFICMLHASWRHTVANANPRGRKVDLLIFTDLRWSSALAKVCKPLNLRKAAAKKLKPHSQCFFVHYPTPAKEVWHGYPFINNVHYCGSRRRRPAPGAALRRPQPCAQPANALPWSAWRRPW